jgi:hypothetical protein
MAPDYYDYSVRKSGKIGAQRAALIYREPLKKGYSSGSLVINEVVLVMGVLVLEAAPLPGLHIRRLCHGKRRRGA